MEPTAVIPDHEREATLALLEGAVPWVAREIIEHAVGSVQGRSAGTRSSQRQAETPMPDIESPCCVWLSQYRPWFWNIPAFQLRNNCYNFASNFVSNTVAQPGRRAGRHYDAFTCEAISQAALADGIGADCSGAARMVAMAVWPGVDFHWYRRHEYFWAHKLGIYAARNVDNSGRLIAGELTPANCDRGPYSQFCAYLFVPPGVQVL
jgi:hypothetical protein